jgi:hypothetical protein
MIGKTKKKKRSKLGILRREIKRKMEEKNCRANT